VIELRLSASDLSRVCFAYSPLAEAAASLRMLAEGRVRPVHQRWLTMAREPLRRVELDLLTSLVPAGPWIASFLFVGAQDPSTTIEDQLGVLMEADPAWVRTEMETAWGPKPLPPAARELIEQGRAGVHRIAAALYDYWQAVLAPHWPRMRAVLDADLTHRAARLTTGGLSALLADLHPELSVDGPTIRIDKPRWNGQHDLAGRGLWLVPSVFAWPKLVADITPPNQPTITYGARGVGVLWDRGGELDGGDALGALLGRTRALILANLDLPLSTTRLATQIGYSAPAVSQHLAVLRQCGLVTSRRAGRSVLYQRTALATSLLAASHRGDRTRPATLHTLV
jgi:DNA-binding transcriptional ArsR family regulator